MNILESHVVLMLLYSIAAALFFALLWKNERSERIRLFVLIFCSLFLGGIALSWLMYPFPVR